MDYGRVKKRVWGRGMDDVEKDRYSVEGSFSDGGCCVWVFRFQEKTKSIYNLPL